MKNRIFLLLIILTMTLSCMPACKKTESGRETATPDQQISTNAPVTENSKPDSPAENQQNITGQPSINITLPPSKPAPNAKPENENPQNTTEQPEIDLAPSPSNQTQDNDTVKPENNEQDTPPIEQENTPDHNEEPPTDNNPNETEKNNVSDETFPEENPTDSEVPPIQDLPIENPIGETGGDHVPQETLPEVNTPNETPNVSEDVPIDTPPNEGIIPDDQPNTETTSPSTQTPSPPPVIDTVVEEEPDITGELNLWVSPIIDKAAKDRPFYAVEWQYDQKNDNYYLYLPTEGSLSAMQVWFSGTTSCQFDDRTIQNGETVDFSKEDCYIVTLGDQKALLTIMKSANIGSMYITTESGNMDYIHEEKSNKETGTMRYVNAKGEVVYSGNLTQIRGRGNATWDKPKKPYQIKLETKTELVAGAGEATTWLLLANYCEKTMLNNTVALNLAYDAGLTDSARSEYMDLYCNNEYMGTYQISEKVQIAKNRIKITDLGKATEKVNDQPLDQYPAFGTKEAVKGTSKGYLIPNDPANITGGYLLEIENNERYVPEPSGFVTTWGTAVVIKEPEYASVAQVAYISNYFQEFEDAVRSPDGINPTTGKRFDEYFDLTSLAKKYILEEFVKNIDADVTSQFYYKPSDSESKVGFCGPVWDYDNSFDVMFSGENKDGLYAATRKKKIYHHLIKHDFFMDEVRKEWKSNFLPAIAVCLGEKRNKSASLQSLTYYEKLLTPSATMNYAFWGEIDVPINNKHVDTGDTYPEHLDYLRNFIIDRRFELNQIWMSS